MKTRYGFCVAFALALGAFSVMADSIPIATLSSGVDNNGVSLNWGVTDTRWQITTPFVAGVPPLIPDTPSTVVPGTTFNASVPYPGIWGVSRYISPYIGGGGVAGNFLYQSQFNMTYVPSLTYTLSLTAWADDTITSATLNGVALTATPLANNVVIFSTTDQSLFATGLKTLQLTVNNKDWGGTGLILAGGVTAVPEASEWAMLIGAGGLGLMVYRKKLLELTQRNSTAVV
jgi:hypothetical protein